MRRRLGTGILAFVLAWLAVAGFANAFFLVAPRGYRQLPQLAAAGRWLWVIAAVAVAYGVTAAVAAIGVWRLAPWAHRAVRWWGATLLALGILFMVVPPWSAAAWYEGAAFLVAVLVLVGLMEAYVRRRVA